MMVDAVMVDYTLSTMQSVWKCPREKASLKKMLKLTALQRLTATRMPVGLNVVLLVVIEDAVLDCYEHC